MTGNGQLTRGAFIINDFLRNPHFSLSNDFVEWNNYLEWQFFVLPAELFPPFKKLVHMQDGKLMKYILTLKFLIC